MKVIDVVVATVLWMAYLIVCLLIISALCDWNGAAGFVGAFLFLASVVFIGTREFS